MKKLMLFIFMFVILLFPETVLAHTGLTSSDPATGETRREPVKEISMVFNTKIEPLSTFELKDGQGKNIPVSHVQVQDSKMTGTLDEPLPNGEYTVNWKIVGRDGHPIEGKFNFTVDVPQVQPEKTTNPPTSNAGESAGTDRTNNSAPTSQPSTQPDANKSTQTDNNDQTGTGNTWIIIIIGLIVTVIVVLLRAFREKKH